MVNKWGHPERVFHINSPGEGNQGYMKGCQRCIDFDKPAPKPYTWGRGGTAEDLSVLLSSGMMFARKFDSRVDQEIISRLESRLIDCNTHPNTNNSHIEAVACTNPS